MTHETMKMTKVKKEKTKINKKNSKIKTLRRNVNEEK